MITLIRKIPILCAILFAYSFEILFQYNMTFMLYLGILYLIFKISGLNGYIKEQAKKHIHSTLRKSLNANIDVAIKRNDGVYESIYTFLKNNKRYLVTVKKTRTNVSIRIIDTDKSKDKPKIFNVKSFFVTRKSIEKFLDKNYFN